MSGAQVGKEMPQPRPRAPKSWGGFLGATLAALVIIAIWFPIRLIHELLKTIDFSEKPDHAQEAQDRFREAYSLLMRPPEQERLRRIRCSTMSLFPAVLHDAFFEAFRALYAENMMLDRAADPAGLGKSRRHPLARPHAPRDRPHEGRHARQDAPRLHRGRIEAAVAGLPKIAGDGEITSPLATLVNPGRFVENLVRPLDAQLFPAFAETLPRQHVSHLGRPARQIRQAAEARRTASPRRPLAVSRRHAVRRHSRDPAWDGNSAGASAPPITGSSPAPARARPPPCNISSPRIWSAPRAANARSSSSTASAN